MASNKRQPRPSTPPPPHFMCTSGEAQDRQVHMELSEFESTAETYALGPRHRAADPRLVIKKYRRSAAGGGVSSASSTARGGARSIDVLMTTIDHLLGTVLSTQRVHPKNIMEPRSLAATVSFVDDRIRAVQVDLTTSLLDSERTDECWATIRTLQAKLVRYGILVSYLLSDLPSTKYEAKFGRTALRTAIDSYFAAWEASFGSCSSRGAYATMTRTCKPTDEELAERDEMLSYEALMHISEGLCKGETALPTCDAAGGAEGGCGAVLASYLGRGGTGAEVPALTDESKWSTALEVAAAADQGNLIQIFRLLVDLSPTASKVHCKRWEILARCCVVPAINVIRIGLVRRYNKSFGKLEKIPGEDLARLLCLPSAESALRFCSDIGLPTEDGKATMKAAPISITDKGAIKRMTSPGRAEDEFVFGRQVLELLSGVKRSLPEPSGMKTDKPSSLASANCTSSSKPSSLAAAASKPSSLANAAKKSSLAAAAAGPKKASPPNPSTKTSLAAKAANSNTNKRWGDDSDSDFDDWESAADNLKYDRAHQTNTSKSDDETSRTDQDAVLIPPTNCIWDIVC
eukprot:CAMPEP_0181034894 /NCGR_PEP_ID=MMETSP1070-20121207/8043_1 /TAXON_ID=265543 /ORGANISM="Minutocellus polymorphus, Strain NH13" /LENGTH=574 /DNA_ID=CAMNT_0023112437 /DNA_START=52 /DNA_END=1776 /DNA_ORIENTATION=-